MYIVPVLVAVDADTATTAQHLADDALRQHALHVDAARALSPARAAVASFHLLVYADGIELPPARDAS
jgi:hypothetical protein